MSCQGAGGASCCFSHRQLCALSVKLADCYGLSDNNQDQERALGEVIR